MSKQVLAFDIGASSGRAVLGCFDGIKISLREVHRFPNDPVMVNGTLYWDVLRLYHEIKQGIINAKLAGGFDAIGIDTWGVDFGLLDKDGILLENPVHYRDARTNGLQEELFKRIPCDDLYRATGIQMQNFNTIFQLFSLQRSRPDLLQKADQLLFIPDLFVNFLTGQKRSEYSIASTSQLLDSATGDWAWDIIDALQIPRHIFCEITDCGTYGGHLSDEICTELGVNSVPVYYVTGHDTAGAVASVPTEKDDFVYISSGTWSLMGTECRNAIINEKSAAYNFTNEGGYGRSVRFLKNIMGLWLIGESRRQWQREGFNLSFSDLEREALASEPFRYFINPDDEIFIAPGDMVGRIQEFCRGSGQKIPRTRGQVMRCIYESLALKYRVTFQEIAQMTGKQYKEIHIVGGGTKDRLLSQFTANAVGVKVVSGPAEATAMGNVAVQMIALGEIDDLKSARKFIRNSFEPQEYQPVNTGEWSAAAEKWIEICN